MYLRYFSKKGRYFFFKVVQGIFIQLFALFVFFIYLANFMFLYDSNKINNCGNFLLNNSTNHTKIMPSIALSDATDMK